MGGSRGLRGRQAGRSLPQPAAGRSDARPYHRRSPAPVPVQLLHRQVLELQGTVGNRATARLVGGSAAGAVQRDTPAATTLPSGKTVDTWLRASPVIQRYVAARMKKGTKAEGNVVIQSEDQFVRRLLPYLLKNAKVHEKATGKPFGRAEAEALAPRVEAYTDDDTKKIYVNEAQCEPSTIIHEALHLFEHDALYLKAGAAAREGASELFTLVICQEQGIERDEYYADELAAVDELVAVAGRTLLADAYFHGKLGPLGAAVDRAKGKGRFARWCSHLRKGQLDQASALLR